MSNARKRVLFVDDEPNFLESIKRLLREQSYAWDMTFCLSTDEALQEVSKAPVDAIVADLKMPDKNGFILLKVLRLSEGTRDIPIIMLTADHDRELRAQALNLGATDLLNKPFREEDLIARIRSALRLKTYQDELKFLNADLEQRVAERTLELADSRLNIIWRLAKAGEYRDEATGNHIVRVGCYCRALAERMGIDRDYIAGLFLTAPLHDIGKIGIPDEILLKPGRLTPEERKIVERHCAIGAEILTHEPKGMRAFIEWSGRKLSPEAFTKSNRFLEIASSIALSHHERWDGSGYPRRLVNNDIPLEGRITAIADVYDALCSVRPYKPAFPEEKVLAIMQEEAGGHFDPLVYAAFEKCIDEFRAIRAEHSDEYCPAPGASVA